MVRSAYSATVLAVLVLLLCATTALAVEKIKLEDKHDDDQRVDEASKHEAVVKFAEELGRFRQQLLAKDKGELRRIFGDPLSQDLADYAMPVAQPRIIALPGLRNPGAETQSAVYAVKDFAALKVWHITDRGKPVAIAFYFAADKAFPRLKGDNLNERLAWDRKRFQRLVKFVEAQQAAEWPKIIAAGEWSKPVADSRGYAVRGRLVLAEKSVSRDRRQVVVYVELQDASEAVGGSMRLFCEFGKTDFRPEYKRGLQCELQDKDKRPVKSTPFPFSGAVPKSEWVTLPSDATFRLRASPFGIHRAKALAIAPDLGKLWVIADDDPNEYYLSGTFTVDPATDRIPPGKEHVWRGTIVLPAVRVVNQRQ
jgi:hypothetical protein